MNLVVKSGMDPAALTSAIRGAIAAIDKDQPIFAISTMTALINASVATDLSHWCCWGCSECWRWCSLQLEFME
jgi:hypothetical protein